MHFLRSCSWYLGIAAAVAAAVVLPATAPVQAATTPNCGAQLLKANGTAWRCTFDDEFAGSTLDPGKWSPVTTLASNLAYGGGCFVNSPSNISVSGGALHLTARRLATPIVCRKRLGSFRTYYTAAQVATAGHFAQTQGLFAVRAKFPAATIAGLQSSIWMWPQYYPITRLHGEIDIAEEYSAYADRVIPYLHYSYLRSTVNTLTGVNVVTTNACKISNVNAFHTYTLLWTPTAISIYYDGRACLLNIPRPAGVSPFNQPFFIDLTQALGSLRNAFNSQTPLPATTTIDWVRAWK